uniref:caspase-8 n=1 Tax=Scatophagus argus TaxID=75038 RepID=UPI001ED85695|nr:caspase-8 [Scatophagus argus]
MEFQKLLFDIGKALCKDEVKALAFLCADLLGRNVTTVESASDLFSRLADQAHLSSERPHLLTELLLIIQRTHLARQFNLTGQGSTTRSLVSPYRKLLYNLSEELTDADLKNVKFLLGKKLPRRFQEENVSTLEVFRQMEHMDLISDINLDLLETVIKPVCPALTEKITQFKAHYVPPISPGAQETGHPGSRTCTYEPNHVPHSHGRTFSNEMPEHPLAESSLNSSNTSVDRPNMVHGGGGHEALQRQLSALSTEESNSVCSEVRSDVTEMLPQKREMPLTTNINTILETYPMTAAKRGTCLIINNYDFSASQKGLQSRDGTMTDEGCLHKVFGWLGFEIETHRDCKGNDILSVMKKLGSRDHSQMDCVVCCILSHGEEGCVYGVDGHTVDIRELMECFNGLNCRSLVEKPKLFFIQACQGKKTQASVSVEADGPAYRLVNSDAVVAKDSIPSEADFLCGMSTVRSYISYREKKNGTWYIQSLCQNLVRMVPRGFDIVSILTKVNADVSQKTDGSGQKKQMPQPSFSLRKKVVFPIPRDPPPVLYH